MKKQIQINIGMNNNPMTNEQIVNYFATHPNYHLAGYYFKDMTFQGEPEPTFVAWLKTDYTRDSKILADFEAFCNFFTQESIALVTPTMSVLAFNHGYKGDPYKFDAQYFEFFLTNKSKLRD
jgi:hypothetical protein